MIEILGEPIAAETRALINATVSRIFSLVPSKISSVYNLYWKNFNYIIEVNYLACTRLRTIINKESSVDLRKIYVKAIYTSNQIQYGDDDIAEMLRNDGKIIVSGFGGIGKTVFLKYLWITFFENPSGRVPIFFELRNTNEMASVDLITHIRLSLAFENQSISPDVFTALLAEGRFVFMLDGFDEVADENRVNIERQIQILAKQFPRCSVIVSSRQDSRFYSWQDFQHFNVMKFNKSQATEVIEKAEFDKKLKGEFRKEILEKRYEKYEDFFGTPLLTLMMLMTYQQIKYIPDNPHEFYKYAFQTLYTLHDASKQGFQRKRFVDLSEAQFQTIFSLFCLVTYVKGQQSFDKAALIQYFEDVKKRSCCVYDSESVFREAAESVNLLYADGNQYTFVHRSFQEYFTAYAATHYYSDSFSQLLDIIPARNSDAVFSMIYSINRDMFEKMYVLIKYNQLSDFIESSLKIKTPFEFLKSVDCKCSIIKIHADSPKASQPYLVDLEFANTFSDFKDRIDLALTTSTDAASVRAISMKIISDDAEISRLGLDKLGVSLMSRKKRIRQSLHFDYQTLISTYSTLEFVSDKDSTKAISGRSDTDEQIRNLIVENAELSMLFTQMIKAIFIELRARLQEIKKNSIENKSSDIDVLAI